MKLYLEKAAVDAVIDNAKHQSDIVIGLYKLVYPNWDDIAKVVGHPYMGYEGSVYIMERCMRFDREHHPDVMNGGLWMNNGFGLDNSLEPWEVVLAPVILNAHFDFLDELRESGETNMYGARPYLMDEFPDLDKEAAKRILIEWMNSYGERHPKEVR